MPHLVEADEARKLETSTLFGRNEKASMSMPIGSPISKNLTGGFIELKPGYTKDFNSPVDEIDLFLEGSLIYYFEGGSFTAKKGDLVYIAKGDKIHFTTEEGCSVFFVTYPLMKETVEALKKAQQK